MRAVGCLAGVHDRSSSRRRSADRLGVTIILLLYVAELQRGRFACRVGVRNMQDPVSTKVRQDSISKTEKGPTKA